MDLILKLLVDSFMKGGPAFLRFSPQFLFSPRHVYLNLRKVLLVVRGVCTSFPFCPCGLHQWWRAPATHSLGMAEM